MYSQNHAFTTKNDAVSHNFCVGCGLCALNCPSKAIVMEEQGTGEGENAQIRKAPSLLAHLCVHCGRCAAVCPSGTIRQQHLEDVLRRVTVEGIRSLAFFCTGLNLAAPSPLQAGHVPPDMSLMDARRKPRLQDVRVPEGVLLEEVRCTGRLGASFLLRLILAGVRELVFFSCGDKCQYAAGGTGIVQHVVALKDMLSQYGVGQGLRFELYQGADAATVARVLEGMGRKAGAHGEE